MVRESGGEKGKATRAEVAAAAGVSGFTVSQVMAGRAGVAAATRERVRAVAKVMGYRPDPAAARLAMSRQRSRRAAERTVVSLLLGQDNSAEELRGVAGPIAEEFGLDLRIHRVTTETMPEAMLRTLWQEGVEGIMLAPGRGMNREAWREADWSRFSVVKTSRGLPGLRFHLVRHAAWDYMLTTLRQVTGRGYRRLAVVLHRSLNESDDLARLGALLAAQERWFPPGTTCEHRECRLEDGRPWLGAEDIEWLRSYRPEVVIVPHRVVAYELQAAGLVPGREFGLAAVLTTARRHANLPLISGNDAQEGEVYARCLRELREMILNGERGMAERPTEQVILPEWVEGETLPVRRM